MLHTCINYYSFARTRSVNNVVVLLYMAYSVRFNSVVGAPCIDNCIIIDHWFPYLWENSVKAFIQSLKVRAATSTVLKIYCYRGFGPYEAKVLYPTILSLRQNVPTVSVSRVHHRAVDPPVKNYQTRLREEVFG